MFGTKLLRASPILELSFPTDPRWENGGLSVPVVDHHLPEMGP